MPKQPAPEIQEIIADAQGVADMLGVSVKTVYAYNSEKKLPPCFRLGRRNVWRRRDIIQWLEMGMPGRGEYLVRTGDIFR